MATQLISPQVRAAYEAQGLADRALEMLTASREAGGVSPELAVPGALVGIGFAVLALRKQIEAGVGDVTDAAAFVAEQVTTAAVEVSDALTGQAPQSLESLEGLLAGQRQEVAL